MQYEKLFPESLIKQLLVSLIVALLIGLPPLINYEKLESWLSYKALLIIALCLLLIALLQALHHPGTVSDSAVKKQAKISTKELTQTLKELSKEEKDKIRLFFPKDKEPRKTIIFKDREKEYDEWWPGLIKQGICRAIGGGFIEGIRIEDEAYAIIQRNKSLIYLPDS